MFTTQLVIISINLFKHGGVYLWQQSTSTLLLYMETMKSYNGLKKIIEDATYDASSKMVAFLSSYYLSALEAYEDADCHHLSLLAMLFCKEDEKEKVAREAWRDFLSGCSTVKDGTMEVYCRIAGDVDAFFSSLVEHSDYLQSYEAACDEDDGGLLPINAFLGR